MEAALYEGLVKDLCTAVGLAGWKDVAHSGHLMVAGRVVGLMHRAQDFHDDALSIYVEFDSAAQQGLRFYERLLHENVNPTDTLHGFFGIHPDTAKVVYCVRMNGTRQWSGEDLATLVEAQVREAERALKTFAD
jgi:hypothetical protein